MTPEEEELVVKKAESMTDEELKQLWQQSAQYILLARIRVETRAQMTPEERQADIELEQRKYEEDSTRFWKARFQRDAKTYGLTALVSQARTYFGATRAEKPNDIVKMRKFLDDMLEILTVEQPYGAGKWANEQFEQMEARLSRLLAEAKREEAKREGTFAVNKAQGGN